MINRRSVLKTLSASALTLGGMGLAGTAAAAAARDNELNILCRRGYNTNRMLDPFREAHDTSIKTEGLANDPAVINLLRSGAAKYWDIVNVNNPWARKVLYPEALIKPLPHEAFDPYFQRMLPAFKAPYKWAVDETNEQLLGMCQRFGPAGFVVNTKKISRETAEKTGWELFNDPKLAGRYGVLESDAWNVFDIFLLAGIDPFKDHSPLEMDQFKTTAAQVFKNARLVGNYAAMNLALAAGDIDLQFTGGIYSVSPARAEGHLELRAITPLTGPMEDRKGGIVWIEVGSLVNNPQLSPLAEPFLHYLQKPEVAHTVAFAEGTYNPVAQMGDPKCFSLFTKKELDALQWDSVEEEMARCVEYDIVPDYRRALDIMLAAKRNRG